MPITRTLLLLSALVSPVISWHEFPDQRLGATEPQPPKAPQTPLPNTPLPNTPVASERDSSGSQANSLDVAKGRQLRLVRQSQVSSYADLKRLVTEMADQPFVPTPPLSPPLAELTYDHYLKIRYRSERATWIDESPFWVETFHRGFVQKDRVDLFIREQSVNRLVPFSASDFQYDLPDFDPGFATDAGHAGIKVIHKFPDSDVQEVLTFLGSSYFRARNQYAVYGTSCRGLAVDVGFNGPEEFPLFRTFWIEKPRSDAKTLSVLALLDSPSVVGAYRFTLKPGSEQTRMVTESQLHFRQDVEKLGIAPLTSMWMWGDGLKGPPKDLRPGVHDSDGLLIRSKKRDWTWRPFSRQSYPSVSRIAVDELVGFGVMQRNTAFFHYDDHNALYHRRPSVFITPISGDWTNGSVEILELPGAHEGVDNIGAYWIPARLPKAGDQIELSYEVSVFGGPHPDETETGQATAFKVNRTDQAIEMQIRFAGGPLTSLPKTTQFEFQIQTIRGTVDTPRAKKTKTGDWLVDVKLTPSENAPMEFQMQLKVDGKQVTEEFVYLCPNKQPEFVYPSVYTRSE